MVGVAVNVTEPPLHMEVAEAAILTLTGMFGLTVMLIALLVAGLPVAHGAAFDVNTTVTTSPLANVDVLYVLLLPPTLAPFNFH